MDRMLTGLLPKMDQLNMYASMLNSRFTMPYLPLPGVLSATEMQQLWKEAAEQGTEEQMKGLNGVTHGLHPALLGLNGLTPDGFSLGGIYSKVEIT